MKVQNIVFRVGIPVLFLLILLWGFRHWRMPLIPIAIFEAIPRQTPLVLDVADWNLLKDSVGKSVFTEHFSSDYLLEKLHADFRQLEQMGKDLASGRVVAALQLSGASQFDFLYLIDTREQQIFQAALLDYFKDKGRVLPSKFRGQNIYNFRSSETEKYHDWSFCQYHNLLLIAPYSLLIEDAIGQIKQPKTNLLHAPAFTNIQESLSPAAAHLYLGLHRLPATLSSFFRMPHKPLLRELESGFSWLGFEVKIGQEGIDLKGLMSIGEGNRLMGYLSVGEKGKIESLANILPENTAVCTWMQIDRWEEVYRKEEDRGGEFQEYFMPWLGKDLAYLITEPYSQELTAERFVAFRVLDAQLAQDALEKYARQKGELRHFDYQTYTIRQVLAGDLLRPVFGESLNTIHDPYFTQLGDYMVFGNSRQSLEVWIDKYIVGQTLSRDSRFLKWQGTEGQQDKAVLYVDPTKASRLLLSYVREDLQKALQELLLPYQQINQWAFQLNPTDRQDQMEVKARFHLGETVQERTTIMWKVNLADTLRRAPESFYNPQKRAYQIFVQDQQNSIYLLDQGGDVLWKRHLDEPVLSELSLIDYYQNGERQLLFNTATKIYLLKENGADVATFPLHLQSAASRGMTLVDFQQRGEYAFFIPCENGNVYGFSQTGSPLPGWNPRPGIGKVSQAIRHFVFHNQDYIVLLNEGGQLYAFKRDGTKRFEPQDLGARITSPMDVDVQEKSVRLVAADKRGRLYVVNAEGGLFHLNLQVGKNEALSFCYSNVTGDQRKDYIGLEDKDLVVYDYTKDGQFQQVSSFTYDLPQDSLFAVSIPEEANDWIGSLEKGNAQINLYNSQGQQYPGFPLAGSTAFQIKPLFGDGQRILVVANAASVYAYKLQQQTKKETRKW